MKRIPTKPFFEFGPKTYIWGQRAVDLAKHADEISEKYNVDIIFTAQYTDLERISSATSRIHLFAQHMDLIIPGIGIGAVLPEALLEAGASGVMLNHEENQLSVSTLHRTIQRANDIGLVSLVCSGNVDEARSVAALNPDIILVEDPNLIGGRCRTAEELLQIQSINRNIRRVNDNVLLMHAAGIKTAEHVYDVIYCGADGTGSTSGIINSEDPFIMMEEMVSSLRKAWDKKVSELNERRTYGI